MMHASIALLPLWSRWQRCVFMRYPEMHSPGMKLVRSSNGENT
jgi:hypothetical protein